MFQTLGDLWTQFWDGVYAVLSPIFTSPESDRRALERDEDQVMGGVRAGIAAMGSRERMVTKLDERIAVVIARKKEATKAMNDALKAQAKTTDETERAMHQQVVNRKANLVAQLNAELASLKGQMADLGTEAETQILINAHYDQLEQLKIENEQILWEGQNAEFLKAHKELLMRLAKISSTPTSRRRRQIQERNRGNLAQQRGEIKAVRGLLKHQGKSLAQESEPTDEAAEIIAQARASLGLSGATSASTTSAPEEKTASAEN